MGVSLPLLSRALAETTSTASRRIASLYGWNTVGAALGSLLTVWVILRATDFRHATWIGAALNAGLRRWPRLWLARASRDARRRLRSAAPAVAATPPPAVLRLWAVDRALRALRLHRAVAGDRLVPPAGRDPQVDLVHLRHAARAVPHRRRGGIAARPPAGRARGRTRRARSWSSRPPSRVYAALSLAAFLFAAPALGAPCGRCGNTWPVTRASTSPPPSASAQRYVLERGAVAPQAHRLDRSAARPLRRAAGVPRRAADADDGPQLRVPAAGDPDRPRRPGAPGGLAAGREHRRLDAGIDPHRRGAARRHRHRGQTLRLLVVLGGVFLALAVAGTSGRARTVAALLAALLINSPSAWRRTRTSCGRGSTARASRTWSSRKTGRGCRVIKHEGPMSVVYVNGVGQSELPYGSFHTVLGALPVLIHPRPEVGGAHRPRLGGDAFRRRRTRGDIRAAQHRDRRAPARHPGAAPRAARLRGARSPPRGWPDPPRLYRREGVHTERREEVTT